MHLWEEFWIPGFGTHINSEKQDAQGRDLTCDSPLILQQESRVLSLLEQIIPVNTNGGHVKGINLGLNPSPSILVTLGKSCHFQTSILPSEK